MYDFMRLTSTSNGISFVMGFKLVFLSAILSQHPGVFTHYEETLDFKLVFVVCAFIKFVLLILGTSCFRPRVGRKVLITSLVLQLVISYCAIYIGFFQDFSEGYGNIFLITILVFSVVSEVLTSISFGNLSTLDEPDTVFYLYIGTACAQILINAFLLFLEYIAFENESWKIATTYVFSAACEAFFLIFFKNYAVVKQRLERVITMYHTMPDTGRLHVLKKTVLDLKEDIKLNRDAYSNFEQSSTPFFVKQYMLWLAISVYMLLDENFVKLRWPKMDRAQFHIGCVQKWLDRYFRRKDLMENVIVLNVMTDLEKEGWFYICEELGAFLFTKEFENIGKAIFGEIVFKRLQKTSSVDEETSIVDGETSSFDG